MKKIILTVLLITVFNIYGHKIYCQSFSENNVNKVLVCKDSSVVNKNNKSSDFQEGKPISTVNDRKFGKWSIGTTSFIVSVVFLLSIILYLFLLQIYLRFKSKRDEKALIKESKLEELSSVQENVSGNVYAVIGLALYTYVSELHDFEEAVLTINKVSRTYSPWNSKIYGLRQTPERR